jgi:hypothetical protein
MQPLGDSGLCCNTGTAWGEAKAKEDEEVAEPSASEDNKAAATTIEANSAAMRYVCRFVKDEDEFVEELERTLIAMTKIKAAEMPETKRSLRTSEDLRTRIASMSGVYWNLGTKASVRDWGQVIVAATLECFIVSGYREDLLRQVEGACVMRKDLRDYFIKKAKTYMSRVHGKHGLFSISEWRFPDGMYDGEGNEELELVVLDPDVVRKELTRARARGSKVTKKDPVMSFVDAIEKNPLLHCSDPEAGPKTLETLASHCISTLIYVSALVSLCFVSFRVSRVVRPDRLFVVRSCVTTRPACCTNN